MNRQNYKKLIITSLLLLVFTFTIGGCSPKDEEGLVAKVNNENITEEEFESEFQLFKKVYEGQYGEDFMTQIAENGETFEENLKAEIMEKLIIEKILFKDAKDKKITVTDEELKEQMDLAIDEMGGQEQLDEYLEDNELTREVLEDNFRKEILVTKYGEKFNNETVISEKEAKKYFDENKENLVVIKVSHILVETEEEGKDIIKRLDEGEDFGAIALIESIDSISAIEGGSLGYFTKGILPVEFEEVAFSLEPGEVSDLIKSDVGYQIIYLEDRKDTYEALEMDLKKLLVEMKYMEKVQGLREAAKVKFFGEFNKK